MEQEKKVSEMARIIGKMMSAQDFYKVLDSAQKICKTITVNERRAIIGEWDDKTAPYLSVNDIESGKADDLLNKIAVERAILVAVFNADQRHPNVIQ